MKSYTSRNPILQTIITPPLVFGVTGAFAFLILFCLFVSSIIIKGILGNFAMLISCCATIYFYFFGVRKSVNDPYWINVFLMSLIFERKRPFRFIASLFTKKDQIFYR